MNKGNIINNNNKLCSSCELLGVNSRKYIKKESLFSQKATLKQILSQIKYCLIDSVSNISEKDKNTITKDILTTFRDNLIVMLEEKNKLYNSFRKEKLAICRQKSDTLKKYRKFIECEKTNDSEDKIIGNQKLLYSDLSQLRLLNFLIENEIQKIDFLIEQNSEKNLYIKALPIYIFEKNEVYCSNNYENLAKITGLLSDDRNEKIKRFINAVNKRTEQENETKSLSQKVEDLKDKIKHKGKSKYINNEEIIFELSNEYTKNTIFSNNNNINKINLNHNNKNFEEKSKNSSDKNIFSQNLKTTYSKAVTKTI